MANLIEDVFGGIAHIMEHAAQYGGDPTRIGVTGDSAGGHLVGGGVAHDQHDRLARVRQDAGRLRVHADVSAEGQDGRAGPRRDAKAIKAAAPSYGVFGAALLNAYSDDPAPDQSWKEAIAPLSHIPRGNRAVGAAVPDARHERSG